NDEEAGLAHSERGYPALVYGPSAGRGLHDLAHHLVEVLIGLVDHRLAGGAVALVEEILDPFELRGRSELLGVRPNAAHDAADELARRHPDRLWEVHQVALQPVPRGEPLVLVERLVRVVAERLAG